MDTCNHISNVANRVHNLLVWSRWPNSQNCTCSGPAKGGHQGVSLAVRERVRERGGECERERERESQGEGRFPLIHIDRCPPRQESRVEHLKAKVEPLSTSVILEYWILTRARAIWSAFRASLQPRPRQALRTSIKSQF